MCTKDYKFNLCEETESQLNALILLLHAPPWTARPPLVESSPDGTVIITARFTSQAEHDDYFRKTVNGRAATRTMASIGNSHDSGVFKDARNGGVVDFSLGATAPVMIEASSEVPVELMTDHLPDDYHQVYAQRGELR